MIGSLHFDGGSAQAIVPSLFLNKRLLFSTANLPIRRHLASSLSSQTNPLKTIIIPRISVGYCKYNFNGQFRHGRFAQLVRRFSTTSSGAGKAKTDAPAQASAEGAPPPTTITFVEGAKTATRLSLFLGIGALVIFCASLIIRELIPTRMSPNSVFNRCFEEIRNHPEVVERVGENPKAYGRDFHQTKEGRRNFVDHDRYTDLDGVRHIRVKFIIEGPKGKANVYAEVNEKMENKEFSYIILEQTFRGVSDAVALVDNRKEMSREEMQEKVAKKLTKNGAKLYGHTNCQWTQRQLVEFGDFAKNLNTVMCDKPENEEQCKKAKLPGYPCWVLAEEQLPGYQPLTQLRDIVQHM